MSDSSNVIGFIDEDGVLCQWYTDDCKCWLLESVETSTLYSQQGSYVLRTEIDEVLGLLARPIPPAIAAELLLGHGNALPRDLLRLIEQTEKPKIQKRSKPRKPTRTPKGQYGLRGIASRQRTQDSRGAR